MRFVDELAARRRFGMKPGLDTIRAVCAALGEPQKSVCAVHVAGTDGKGAVCAMLDACLRAAGLRVGRYTSPHLVQLNERFCLAGEPIDDATLERAASSVSRLLPRFPDLTFFEALTAVAFRLYADAAPDCTILECGLGGRLDATNVCEPVLTVITRIGLDHCDWLGDTVEKIAAEKAGILKTGVPIVLAANDPCVREVVSAHAARVGAPYFYAPDLASVDEVPDTLSLGGAFNRENAATALAALRVMAQQPRFADVAAPTTCAEGLAHVVWPGRFQRVRNFIVDGAHNPPAAQALAVSLGDERRELICGFCGDKDATAVLHALAPHVTRVFAVRTNNPRSLTADETAAVARQVGLSAEPCASLADALVRVGERPTLICGSLFLAGEALVALDAYPWGKNVRFDPTERLKI